MLKLFTAAILSVALTVPASAQVWGELECAVVREFFDSAVAIDHRYAGALEDVAQRLRTALIEGDFDDEFEADALSAMRSATTQWTQIEGIAMMDRLLRDRCG